MLHFQNILVCIKTAAQGHTALAHAEKLALASGAALKLLSVIEDSTGRLPHLLPATADLERLIHMARREELAALAAGLEQKGLKVTARVIEGRPSDVIIEEAVRDAHDLVLITAHEVREPREPFFGTTALRLMRRCPCPLWVVQPGRDAPYERILAAVDPLPGEPEREAFNRQVLELAQSLAAYEEGKLHVLHVWSLYGEEVLRQRRPPEEVERLAVAMEAQASRTVKELLAASGVAVDADRVFLVNGDPGEVIPRFAAEKRIDAIVMGTVGRTGISGFLIGNTAEKVLGLVECSVLTVKPAAFAPPAAR
jgi:universal stress protein E